MESLKTILYFSIFNYPIKLEEIYDFSKSKDIAKIKEELSELILRKIIFKVDDFYLSTYDLDAIEKRKKGNQMAIKALIKAKERAAFIAKFPYVRAVGVSGSLSKGYYDNDSDIDFFVITTPSKLWITRTFLMLYKKIFLLNSRKYFCINYFMSQNSLEIEEKNRFTATEIKTLIPFQGKTILTEFYKKNEWVSDTFWNMNPTLDGIPEVKKNIFVHCIESVLNTRFGDWMDNTFKKITIKKWKSKFDFMSDADFNIALKSTKNISKHHPLNFQKKVITALNEKYEEVYRNYNIVLSKEYV